MKKDFFHYLFIFFTVLLVAFSLNFSANASSNKNDINKKQIISSLLLKAKNALISGDYKMAENYWQQVKGIDSSMKKPAWLEKNAYKNTNKDDNIYTDEAKFIKLLYEMPYEKAKIELDKKLLFNPNNRNLRLVYLDLAEKNKDLEESESHRKLLGIESPKPSFNYVDWLKYFLIIILLGLIIYEVVRIFRISKTSGE